MSVKYNRESEKNIANCFFHVDLTSCNKGVLQKYHKCQCGAPYEDSIHFLMECPLYQNERYCLFRNVRETNKNIETLIFGNDENENSNIFNKVRAYIRQTKRF